VVVNTRRRAGFSVPEAPETITENCAARLLTGGDREGISNRSNPIVKAEQSNHPKTGVFG